MTSSSFDIENSILSFTAIPLWQGVQKLPGVRCQYPFQLGFFGLGPIRQVTENEVVDRVVDAYQSSGYDFITPPPGASDWANSLGNMYAKWVFDAMGSATPRRVLEIGAGSLYVAKLIASRFSTTEYVVVDPSIRESSPGPEFEVLREYFPCEALGSRKFDLVLALNCLEHVPDPMTFCRSISDSMEPDAHAVLVFPDCGSALASGDLNVLVHEHLTYFTKESVRWLVTSCGFTVQALESMNDTFVVVLSKDHVGKQDVVAARVLEQGIQLLRRSAESFQQVLTNKAATISNVLAAGRKVGFHGATNGLNIFLHLTDIGKHPGVRIYDGDSSKAGYFLPACENQIIASDDQSYGDNDLICVSAMSYYDAIERFAIERHGLQPWQIARLSAECSSAYSKGCVTRSIKYVFRKQCNKIFR